VTHSASTLVHDDISGHIFVTMSTIGVTSVIAHASRVARDVPSLAQFYL
jgi:hypothetical protein